MKQANKTKDYDSMQYSGPYTVVVIDTFDANPFADVFDDSRYAVIGSNYTSLESSKALADRLFDALNPNVKSQTNWTDLEGHDVRIFDATGHCLYKAHEKLPH